MALFGLFNKKKKESLDKGLEKTKESVFKKLSRAIVGKSKVDDEVLDNLEEVLISSDVGVDTTLRIIERIEERVQRDKYVGTDELNRVLKEEIVDLLKENNSTDYDALSLPEGHGPYVIMVVGVNGVGKTTTIGKLAHKFKDAGKSVVLGAADTFRAAAVDQLVIWAERVGVPIVKQGMGADPASVAFDTLSKAKAEKKIWRLFLEMILGIGCCYIYRFFRGIGDVSRIEKASFEDDEYFYYVKAVPKIKVTQKDRNVTDIKSGENEDDILFDDITEETDLFDGNREEAEKE